MKYLKLFKQQTDYQSFIKSDKFVTPNVSFATEENIIFCNPLEENPSLPNNMIRYTASGKLSEISINYSVVSHEFVDGVGTITFNEDVTKIRSGAFQYRSSLTSIEIPNSVTEIGDYAFNTCSHLTSIVIPDGVTKIGQNAFQNCSSLTSIEIPDSVTSIENYTFDGCLDLTSVTIGSGVTYIGYSAFRNCSSLTSIEIPDSVTSIGEYIFDSCPNLTSIYYNSTMSNWKKIEKGYEWDGKTIERIICIDGVIEQQNTTTVGGINLVWGDNIKLAVNESDFIRFNIMDETWKNYITDAVENGKDGNFYYYEYDNSSLSVRTAYENMKGGIDYDIEVTALKPGTYTLRIYAGPDIKGGLVYQNVTVTVTE